MTGAGEPGETCGEVTRVTGGGGEATRDNEATHDVSESSLENLNGIERFKSARSVSRIFRKPAILRCTYRSPKSRFSSSTGSEGAGEDALAEIAGDARLVPPALSRWRFFS